MHVQVQREDLLYTKRTVESLIWLELPQCFMDIQQFLSFYVLFSLFLTLPLTRLNDQFICSIIN